MKIYIIIYIYIYIYMIIYVREKLTQNNECTKIKEITLIDFL